jgi:hypothetical protein
VTARARPARRAGSSRLVWDGERLDRAPGARGRRFRADPRCFAGEPVRAWAHVCALPDERARLPFDDAAVQHARREALAWWIPLLGPSLVALTTLAVDSVHYGGAVTVASDPRWFALDPFARIFPGTTIETDLFGAVPPPAGPLVERTNGVAWPGGEFPARARAPR